MPENLRLQLKLLGAETVTVNAVSALAVVDVGGSQVGDVVLKETSLLLVAADVPAAAAEQTVTLRAQTYKVRLLLPEPPDGLLLRLVLARS